LAVGTPFTENRYAPAPGHSAVAPLSAGSTSSDRAGTISDPGRPWTVIRSPTFTLTAAPFFRSVPETVPARSVGARRTGRFTVPRTVPLAFTVTATVPPIGPVPLMRDEPT